MCESHFLSEQCEKRTGRERERERERGGSCLLGIQRSQWDVQPRVMDIWNIVVQRKGAFVE